MIVYTNFNMDEQQREILSMDKVRFPYTCRCTRLQQYADWSVPWHWHPVFEVNCVVSGEVEYRAGQKKHLLRAGDVLFINTNVLHTSRSVERRESETYNHMFDMHLLSGMYGSIYEEKYFMPIRRSRSLQSYLIRPDSYTHIRMVDILMQTIETAREEREGYEFDIRAQLCDFWRLLWRDTMELRRGDDVRDEGGTKRVKIMMEFVRRHFAEPLSVADIAKSVGVSERECTRCFAAGIEMSPMRYLNEYRVSMAARQLLYSDASVVQIAEACGFASASYFSAVFHRSMGMTPGEYRRLRSAPQTRDENGILIPLPEKLK